jgi:TonB family protein
MKPSNIIDSHSDLERACTLPAFHQLAKSLIQRAARRAPPELGARLEEEWSAHLATRGTALSRLGFAFGCGWAGHVIAHEALVAGATAGSARERTLALFGPNDASFLSRRTAVLLAIVALHALVFYGFVSGFARQVIERGPSIMHGHMLPTSTLPHETILPPSVPHSSATPQLHPLALLPPIHFPDDAPTTGAMPSTVETSPLVHPTLPPARRIAGGPGRAFPDADQYYPSRARREGTEGVATVRVCVDAAGRLNAAPTLAKSSGSAILDDGALTLARAGSGRYRSSTENGRPVDDCYAFRVRFALQP